MESAAISSFFHAPNILKRVPLLGEGWHFPLVLFVKKDGKSTFFSLNIQRMNEKKGNIYV